MTETRYPDEALVEAAKLDPANFDKVYRTYVQPIFRYLFSHVGNRQDAEELTAQTFLSAFERLPSYRHNGHFPAWLFSIARNKTADFYRKRSRWTEADLGEDVPAEYDIGTDVLESSNLRALSQLIKSLPDSEQELLRLRFVAELTFGEIAALQGRKLEAVKKTQYRLLARLQTQLENAK